MPTLSTALAQKLSADGSLLFLTHTWTRLSMGFLAGGPKTLEFIWKSASRDAAADSQQDSVWDFWKHHQTPTLQSTWDTFCSLEGFLPDKNTWQHMEWSQATGYGALISNKDNQRMKPQNLYQIKQTKVIFQRKRFFNPQNPCVTVQTCQPQCENLGISWCCGWAGLAGCTHLMAAPCCTGSSLAWG